MRAGGKTLLDAVTLAFAPGECIAIVGPNGAGKTTLLRLLSGELRPRAGAVRLKGRDVASYTPRMLAEHRAVLSQDITVVFPFTVAEVVRMGAGDRRGPRIESLVAEALRGGRSRRRSGSASSRRCRAASSSARILPACWCSLPAARPCTAPAC